MLSKKGNVILKVDGLGFLVVPKSGQKHIFICILKHIPVFARAACTHTRDNMSLFLSIHIQSRCSSKSSLVLALVVWGDQQSWKI